jgi:ferredoxin, 2Fe-2S
MPKINFELFDSSTMAVDVEVGTTIRDAAIGADVPGIEGECGGSLNCATCHVYVATDSVDRMPPLSEVEDEMLDDVAAERLPTSRLGCQLVVDTAWGGCAFRVPACQY